MKSKRVHDAPASKAKTGDARGRVKRVRIADGRYRVWTKKIGKGSADVLLLHGGPGANHLPFTCFEAFLPKAGIGFHYYDQLGCGLSDRPTEKNLWTIKRYVEEVEEVRRALGIKKIVLFGHSWGGLLAIEYALRYPQHVAGLVICSMTASMASYTQYLNQLRKQLPRDVLGLMDRYEKKKDFDAPEYMTALVQNLYAKYFCHPPLPDALLGSIKYFNKQIYKVMQGPNEFVVTGNLKRWDRWKDLERIEAPTLLMVGANDTISVADMREMSRRMPNGKLVVCKRGTHFSMYDDQKSFFSALILFLKSIR